MYISLEQKCQLHYEVFALYLCTMFNLYILYSQAVIINAYKDFTFCFFNNPARRELGVYRDPHVRSSIRHTFGFQIIIKVPLNQIFSNFHKLLCTIKYRLSSITVYFTFTVPELWPFFS